MALLRQMVAAGEVDHLVPERVWAETRKALGEPQPSAFLQVLRQSGALAVVFPEVDALYGVPQRAEYHPEINTGAHVEMVLNMAAQLAPGDDLVGFCALTHDLGKALTPANMVPPRRPRSARRGAIAGAGGATRGSHGTRGHGRTGLSRAFERAPRAGTEAGDAAETAGVARFAAPPATLARVSDRLRSGCAWPAWLQQQSVSSGRTPAHRARRRSGRDGGAVRGTGAEWPGYWIAMHQARVRAIHAAVTDAN